MSGLFVYTVAPSSLAMAYYAVALLCALLFFFSGGSALSEENLQIRLYLDRTVDDGPNRNAIFSVATPEGFGSIHMRDRLMADGVGSRANIVGRAQSVNFKTTADARNTWTISLSLVFEDASR